MKHPLNDKEIEECLLYFGPRDIPSEIKIRNEVKFNLQSLNFLLQNYEREYVLILRRKKQSNIDYLNNLNPVNIYKQMLRFNNADTIELFVGKLQGIHYIEQRNIKPYFNLDFSSEFISYTPEKISNGKVTLMNGVQEFKLKSTSAIGPFGSVSLLSFPIDLSFYKIIHNGFLQNPQLSGNGVYMAFGYLVIEDLFKAKFQYGKRLNNNIGQFFKEISNSSSHLENAIIRYGLG